MAETYTGVTYRLLDDDGHLIEQVTVAAGSYEDTRLGLEVLEGDGGWQRVDPHTPARDETLESPVARNSVDDERSDVDDEAEPATADKDEPADADAAADEEN
jgi:hypothetical protein